MSQPPVKRMGFAMSGKLLNSKNLTRLGLCSLSVYFVLCLTLYLAQSALLFPSHRTRPMPASWTPSAGEKHAEAFINGQCGRLAVARWEVENARGTVMVFHGNGETLASVEWHVAEFQRLHYSVMAWDYPGYGKSSACRFTQQSLLQDAETAYQWLAHQVPASSITLYGRSIGTGIALHVASQHPVARILLVAPYDSLLNVVSDHVPAVIPVAALLRFPMPASDWIGQVQAKLYAIHGKADQLIRPERARQLLQYAHNPAEIEWVDHAGHDDLLHTSQYEHWLGKSLSDDESPQ